jgi:deoxyribonuclease V
MADLLENLPDLTQHLWDLIAQIPAGQVTTCGQLATALGDVVAARWVGQVTLHHRHAPDCPCHRVIRAGGEPGGYVTGELAKKLQRLSGEGVRIENNRVDLAACNFTEFRSDRPLERLRQFQASLAEKFSDAPPDRSPARIGAVDVSYATGGQAVAAYGLFSMSQPDEFRWSTTMRQSIDFPYISSYLAFRELPILLRLIDAVRASDKLAEVILVDGSGTLHPRRAGIATMLGIVADAPTIGVTKKLLCGSVDTADLAPRELRPVMLDGQHLGFAIGPPSGSRKPLYVSPGHRTNVDYCRQVIEQIVGAETASRHRVLEPIYAVDRLSRDVAKGH